MSDEPQLTEPLELFYSYSHKDEDLRDELETHLSMLKRQKVISQWHDRGILAGEEWGGEIDEHLKAADIILLLVSANFLASDYCYDIELKLAMERHEAGEARVVPVILRPCDWSGAPFGKLQALPKNARPVTTWPNRDEAFTDIAKGIRKTAENLCALRKQAEPSADTTTDPRTTGATKSRASQIPRPPVVGFVARRDEQGRDIIGRLKEELAPEKNQLVALWGPGGSGKTTLAAEFVRATEGVFKGRVAWVSALGRTEFGTATLLDEVATKLGREDLRKLAPEAKAAEVGALVSDVSTLVVLDNFETISEEEQVRCLDFLAHAVCPALVTTRHFINRDDVNNVPLAAMTMGEARDFLQRLIERTRTPSNFSRLDRDDLIRRCEANPLVLQWVVRQVDLAKRPQDVLDDLAHGEGDAAERVFTHSFNLPQLGDDGRAALLALSLFTPDASREALANVSGFSNDLRRLSKAVEDLSALWLIETTAGNDRLFLRGLTRELARWRLASDKRAAEIQQLYVKYFLAYVQAHAESTPEDLDALEAEKDNVLKAIEAAFELKDWQSGLSIRVAADSFLKLRGYWDEALRSGELADAAAHASGVEFDAIIATTFAAEIRIYRGELEEAEKVYRRACEAFGRLGHEANAAACLQMLGLIAQDQNDLDKASKFYDESLEIFKRLDNQGGVSSALHQLGFVAQLQFKFDKAHELYNQSLTIDRLRGDQRNIAVSLHQLGWLAQNQNRRAEARKFYSESLEINKRLGAQNDRALTLYNLGLMELADNNRAEAILLLRESLTVLEKLGSPDAEDVRVDLEKAENESA